MLLSDFHKNDAKLSIMTNHRQNYNKFKSLVSQRKFDAIDIKQVNKEKDLVIQHLNNCQKQQLMEQFQQLSFYQEKYLMLSKFMTNKNEKGIDSHQISKFIQIFQENFQTEKQSDLNFSKPIDDRAFKNIKPFQMHEKEEKNKSNSISEKTENLGPSSMLNEFFQKKERQIKPIGFKNLIQKSGNIENRGKPSFKKNKMPNRDIEVKKLLEQNKRLHLRLEKRAIQDIQLNQFQKNVLREQKQRCMKRIEQLEEEVQQLAKDNYKLQQLSRQRSKKGATTFINEDSIATSKNQLLPYYIPTRRNNLQLITEKNNLARSENNNKNNLLNIIDIPPIQKKQQHSFDEPQIQDKYKSKSPQIDNYVLQGLLQQEDNSIQRESFSNNQRQSNPEKKDIFGQRSKSPKIGYRLRQQVQSSNQRGFKSNISNDSINNGNRFESFSMAKTAYYNSSLFLNASKNQVAMDSATSTRNKVAFFKNSLVIFRDRDYEIAFKKSSLDPSYSQVRLIFYINNKTNFNQPVYIQYDYETNYYVLRVTEKLRNVNPNSQSREVIEVDLMPKCSDLNSVMDVHLNIGQRKFDLWVPLCFIIWTSQTLMETGQVRNMIIQPDRQFSSYENTCKILPLSRLVKVSADENQAYLFGRSKFGNHEIKLTWWHKELTIDASTNILDFLAFIMHHFK